MKLISLCLMKSLLFALCISSLFANGPKTIHALIGIDTLTNVKFSTAQDAKHMKSILEHIAQETGLKLKLKILEGAELRVKNVSDWLAHLKRKSNDIVLFYYSGHGYRIATTKGKWPNIYFPIQRQAIQGSWLVDAIAKIKPRLSLILMDCCNSVPVAGIVVPQIAKNNRIIKSPFSSGFHKLFQEAKGMVIASSSAPGQNSFGIDKGGVFTIVLINTLMNHAQEAHISWETILQKTKETCKQIQTPQFEIKK